MDMALRGEAMFDEIDDFVDKWHECSDRHKLSEFLGMSPDEYSLWLSDPSYIGLILAARHDERSLLEAVNDNYSDLTKLAARSDKSEKVARLRAWIAEQEKGWSTKTRKRGSRRG